MGVVLQSVPVRAVPGDIRGVAEHEHMGGGEDAENIARGGQRGTSGRAWRSDRVEPVAQAVGDDIRPSERYEFEFRGNLVRGSRRTDWTVGAGRKGFKPRQ